MLLKVEHLTTSFTSAKGTVLAVNDISFSLPAGKTLCLVGESGSGKSVTALSILRLIEKPGKIDSGKIFLEGTDLLTFSEKQMQGIRGSQISMIFQDPMTSLNPAYTVGAQIQEVLNLHQKLNKRESQERAIEILKSVAISSPETRLKEYPFRLSGGMRQRVMIAMAMACKPRLLIADEPTTSLDVTIQSQILALMHDLKNQQKTAMLFITHDLGVVSEIADLVAVMYTGQIVESTSATQLFQHPLHPYTEGLLKSLPSQNQVKKSRLYSIPDKVPSLYQLPSGCTFWPRCPYAQPHCQQERPLLKEVSPGHQVACFKAQGEF
ncbi:MAG: ABC transporter ATP-binding protein [Planctomycetota bacterium]